MRKLILPTALASLLLLSGCAEKNNYFTSNEHFVQDETNNFIIANDFINFVQDYYTPSSTKFVIDKENNASSFARTLESRLREKGYAVGYANMNETAWLSWKISAISENEIVVTYHIQDSKFSQIYNKSHGTFKAKGDFSVFNEPKRRDIPIIEEIKVEPIVEQKPIPNPPKENEIWETFVNQNSYLHIREEPTKNSAIVGTLKKSTKIETDVNFKNKKWLKIESMDGYVSKRYVKYLHPKNANGGDLVYAPHK